MPTCKNNSFLGIPGFSTGWRIIINRFNKAVQPPTVIPEKSKEKVYGRDEIGDTPKADLIIQATPKPIKTRQRENTRNLLAISDGDCFISFNKFITS